MTEVEFHFNVPDRLGYACRLLRKATRQGVGVAVTAPAATLDQFDQLLWSFGETEFIPHLRLSAGQMPEPRLRRSPVWLVDEPVQAGHLPVLVNLGDEAAPGLGSFERLIEIVSTDGRERDAGRQRWRHYSSRGYPIKQHQVGG